MDHEWQHKPTTVIATVLERLRSWLAFEVSQGDPSPNTLRSYLGSARSFLIWCNSSGTDPISATTRDLKEYRAYLLQHGYRPTTIATNFAGIKRLYTAMKDWGWREGNPADDLKIRKDLTSRSEKIISKYIPDRSAFLKLYRVPDTTTIKGKRDQGQTRSSYSSNSLLYRHSGE